MPSFRQSTAVLGITLLLGACSFVEEAIYPSVTGGEAGSGQESAAAVQTASISPGQPTGTVVGQKVQELRGNLDQLQRQVESQKQQLEGLREETRGGAANYNRIKADINARLQVGTTPGNPELVAQWNQAQAELDSVAASVDRMNQLANGVSNSVSLAEFLLDSVRASYGLSGAVDEDHRQLAVLEDQVNKTVVEIDRVLGELTEGIARQTNYLAGERADLTTMSVAIKNGEYLGGSLANRVYGQPLAAPAGGGAALVGQRPPLVVIRFDRPSVDYEQALYTAVSGALQQRPDAVFDLVAVAPSSGSSAQVALNSNSARRSAEQVFQSLTRMGLPAGRVSLSSTASAQTNVNEVHLYVR